MERKVSIKGKNFWSNVLNSLNDMIQGTVEGLALSGEHEEFVNGKGSCKGRENRACAIK